MLKFHYLFKKTTYYRVVDRNNASFNANKTDKTVQDYVPNGNEVTLANYTLKAMEGQNFTASGERQFDGYKLYQAATQIQQLVMLAVLIQLVPSLWMLSVLE